MKRGGLSKDQAIAEIVQSLRKMFKAIRQYSEEVLKRFDVTGPQLWLLKTLQQEGGSIGALSQRMYLHISTVSGIVDRLEKKGYVTRKKGSKDGRVVFVRLTRAGEDLVAKTPDAAQGKLLYGLRSLSSREVTELHRSLHTLVCLMEVDQVQATFFFSEE